MPRCAIASKRRTLDCALAESGFVRGERLELASSTAIAVLLLAGCIPVPVPTAATPPRFSAEQIAALTPGTTRESIETEFGSPDLRRAGDRWWIYEWNVHRGRMYILPGYRTRSDLADDVGPMRSDYSLLVLRFDASGALEQRFLSPSLEGSANDRYCTTDGWCIEEPVPDTVEFKRGHADAGIELLEPRFVDALSAVTVAGLAKEMLPWPAADADQCRVVLWTDRGMRLTVDDGAAGMPPPWVPEGSFAVVLLRAGDHVLRRWRRDERLKVPALVWTWRQPAIIWHWEQAASGPFSCRSGETKYLELAAGKDGEDRAALRVIEVDEATAQQLIAAKPRLLPPETRCRDCL